ncbi:MAG: nitrous oxide reductase family maturation protein NosD [Candidatus Hodarchaeota archaeon]
MRNYTKKKLILLILGLIFEFSLLIHSNLIFYQGKDSGNLNNDNKPDLKNTGYWNVSPIIINGNSGWEFINSTYEWCNGAGTWDNPYIIENVTIDAGWSDSGIYVQSSTVFFIIRNCTFYYSGSYESGIKLMSVSNGQVKNNTCLNNWRAIRLENGNNITISNNIVKYSNEGGIHIGGGSNNTISKNKIEFTTSIAGIVLINTQNTTIYDNIAVNNGNGIEISGDNSEFNDIYNNTANNNNYDGIKIADCQLNNVSKNIVNFNGLNGIFINHDVNDMIISNNEIMNNDNGIFFDDYNINNTISENKIHHNSIGIELKNSNNNLFYKNIIINNSFSAIDNGIVNQWDNEAIGNYWSDYTGTDSNGDGIGDTPYSISGSAGSQDNFPIFELPDNAPPSISIISPSIYDVFGFNAPNFEIIIGDQSPINTTWYTIDGGTTNYTFSGLTGIVNQIAWDNKGTESIILRFYANDSLGHIGFKDVVIWKDLIAPRITINSPALYQLCCVDAPSFSLTIDEPNIQTKLYSINGRPNITFTTQTQFSQSEWNSAGNGTVLVTFYVIDKVGNTNSSDLIVRKDAYIPDITIHTPEQNKIFGNTSPEFNISIIEDDLVVSMWYIIQGNITQHPITGLTGTISHEAWNHAIEGNVTITFYAQDRAGNIGTERVTVIKSIPTPTAIPGYNLFVLLGFSSVIIIIIRRKWRILFDNHDL